MSHFTVLVIGENPEDQLAPFDENLETPRYVEHTKEQLIAKGREEIEDYKNGSYAEFLADPVKYRENCSNDRHMNYIENEFPLKLNWTDEEVYKEQVGWYEPENVGINGEVYSDRNPLSKWDWYQLGGRWTGMFKLKPVANKKAAKVGKPGLMTESAEPGWVDQALKKDIDFESMNQESFDSRSKTYDEFEKKHNADELKPGEPYWDYGIENQGTRDNFIPETREQYLKRTVPFSTFALIKDGKWYEKGKMGWWGVVSDQKEKDAWAEEFNKLLNEIPDDTLISVFDCHI